MRLEELDIANVKELPDRDLYSLRNVANRLYESGRRWMQELAKRKVGVARPISRDALLDVYSLLTAEMESRGLSCRPDALDGKIVRKRLRGIDVSELPPITVRDSIVSLSGLFVTDPRRAKAVEVRVDAGELSDEFTQELEKRMAEAVMSQAGRPVVVRRDAEGLASPVLPVYDLMLVPRMDTLDQHDIADLAKRLDSLSRADLSGGGPTTQSGEDNAPGASLDANKTILEPEGLSVEFSKPYPSEHAARQLDPKQFREFHRENDKFGPGVHAIWGVTDAGKSKLQAVRFSAAKHTPAWAKKWLRDHDMKSSLEEASGVKKSDFVKNEAERIVGGIVYTKNTVDAQGDMATGPEIYEAMKRFMVRGHPIKVQHEGKVVNCPVIECFFAETDVSKGGQTIPAGSWYLANYIPPEQESLWKAIKDGEITGFSMAGKATAVEI
jgi:hypothetical protein